MLLLHDPSVRDSIRARIEALSPTATRRWGRMSVGQMLWHCNQVLRTSFRDMQVVPRRPPVPADRESALRSGEPPARTSNRLVL